jgi:hypothetical protein
VVEELTNAGFGCVNFDSGGQPTLKIGDRFFGCS